MMSTELSKRLSEKQRQELEWVVQTTREVKIYRRAKVILYKDMGDSPSEIEEHTEYSEREQSWWLKRYVQGGLLGLKDRPRCDRPRRARWVSQPASCPPTVPQFGDYAHATLQEIHAHHPKPYLRDRALMVPLRDKRGMPSPRSWTLLGGGKTVRGVLDHYDRKGLRGLYRQAGSGRAPRLRAEPWQQVKTWVLQGPNAVGFRFVKWTTRSLQTYIDKRWQGGNRLV
jgi:transposase